MQHATIVLITLFAYKIVLILIGVAASRKNKDETDFFLGGRGMGPWVASLSASASSSSAWTLLGVSGAAYLWGVSAFWLFPACMSGFLLNWCLVAPRLRRISHRDQALTVTDVLAGDGNSTRRKAIAITAACIILFSLLFYVAAQFQGSGKTFQNTFNLTASQSILIGSAIIVFYTMAGGFWAVSLTDSLQGLVMAATAILLPIAAIVATGGPAPLWTAIQEVPIEGFSSPFRNMAAPGAIGFVVGLMGIGLGYPGQPHVVNRFMALRDERGVRMGRRIAISWAFIVYLGMILLGLCGRVLFPDLADNEMVFLHGANNLFHPVISGIMVAGVLSATMSTADSQLLVAASCVTHDLPGIPARNSLLYTRLVVFLLSAGAVMVALFASSEIFSRVLFAWTAMGSAFGPLLLVTLLKGPVDKSYTLAAMLTGFLLSVTAYSISWAQGTWIERVLPFLLALAIAWAGQRKAAAMNGDRAMEKVS